MTEHEGLPQEPEPEKTEDGKVKWASDSQDKDAWMGDKKSEYLHDEKSRQKANDEFMEQLGKQLDAEQAEREENPTDISDIKTDNLPG